VVPRAELEQAQNLYPPPVPGTKILPTGHVAPPTAPEVPAGPSFPV